MIIMIIVTILTIFIILIIVIIVIILIILIILVSLVSLDLQEIRKTFLTELVTTWNQEMIAHLKMKIKEYHLFYDPLFSFAVFKERDLYIRHFTPAAMLNNSSR